MKEKTHILVFSASIAKRLLEEGYIITSLKPNRDLPNASVFVFLNEDGLQDKINELKGK